MKEYIKKFDTANDANQYAINDIPFIASVATDPIQNLTCNEGGKKLVNDNGVVEVVNKTSLISFTVFKDDERTYVHEPHKSEYTEQCEEGMTIGEFIDSEYNVGHENYYEDEDWRGNETYGHNYYDPGYGGGFTGFFLPESLTEDDMDPNLLHYTGNPDQKMLSEDTVIHEGDVFYYFEFQTCLLGDTEVTMADGSTKQIKDLVLGDEVLSLDLTTSEQVSRKVIFTDADKNKSASVWDEWEFSDGTIIKTTHRHEFYNVEAGKFKYLDKWKLGEHTYKIDGTTPELIKHTVHEEVVNHYKITLEGSNNFFANGLLTGDRYCNKLEIKLK